ncbi:MAG TPA: spermidine/putrescine ABC transporter substrate-binding protein [Candidatus Cloacimonadota bacterium]|nr:spermidine/putrescine ABC transporter substrate-binding protein [Candidatus Cloacimonadota bacterium]HPS39537.1 spermidine/putrescine ABC transporter substrate-binding protein [Candidatus Cloacimonadota bacterium]
MKKIHGLAIFLILLATVLTGGCGKKQQVLYIFNWSDYIAPELITRFEKENNCKIKYSTYDSNENMLTKVRSSKESFDILFPSGDHVTILAKADLLEPLDKTKLVNYPNLDPNIMKKAESFDPGNKYAIPYFWGLTGYLYNKKNVPQTVLADSSWSVISNPYFKGKNKITMLDDAREVVGAAMILAGYNLNDTSETAMKAAKAILAGWDNNITQFDSDSYKNEVPDGTTWLAQAYNGDALQQMASNPDLGFSLPKEGTSMWMDNMVILKSASSKELAYKFLDFLCDPEVARINAEYTQYATPNKVASDMLSPEIRNNPLIYPDKTYLDKCFMIEFIGDKLKAIDSAYEQIKMFNQ